MPSIDLYKFTLALIRESGVRKTWNLIKDMALNLSDIIFLVKNIILNLTAPIGFPDSRGKSFRRESPVADIERRSAPSGLQLNF